MPDLKYRQEKIQEKRKQTPWREFVMEVCSRWSFNYRRDDGHIHKGYVLDRVGGIVDADAFQSIRNNQNEIESITEGDFFSCLMRLRTSISFPHINSFGVNEKVHYSDLVAGVSHVYLSNIVTSGSSHVYYSARVNDNVHYCLDSLGVMMNCDTIYQSSRVTESSHVFFSKSIHNSSNTWYSIDCIGCSFLYGCSGLTNQSYCIYNKQFEKENYFDEVSKLRKQSAIDGFEEMNNGNSTCISSENIASAYRTINTSTGRNLIFCGAKDASTNMYDIASGGRGSHYYGCFGVGAFAEHVYCSGNIVGGMNIFYSYLLENCSFCLGCVGLKNKSYCIFNTQYTKEERHQKVDEIFTKMEHNGTLGKFFPGSMNPFYFNDTAAYLIDDSFTKEEVEAAGYLRRDEPVKVDIPAGVEVVKTSELDQYEGWQGDEWTIDPSILKKIIQDEQGNVYRIIRMEYDFLVKHGFPLPRKHWLERLKGHFKIG